jgi:hypothetical protein
MTNGSSPKSGPSSRAFCWVPVTPCLSSSHGGMLERGVGSPRERYLLALLVLNEMVLMGLFRPRPCKTQIAYVSPHTSIADRARSSLSYSKTRMIPAPTRSTTSGIPTSSPPPLPPQHRVHWNSRICLTRPSPVRNSAPSPPRPA